MQNIHQCDVLIIGTGAAGLTLALNLPDSIRVTLLSKDNFHESSTLYAQGGIAAVVDDMDDVENHITDTLISGCGLSDPRVVRFTAENAKTCVDWLTQQGVPFTGERDSQGQLNYHLTQEGGHSHHRIVHAADATGRAIQLTLSQQVERRHNTKVYEYRTAIDLILQQGRTTGAYVLNTKTQHVETYQAKFVILATGGASKVYLYTSNPDTATGDGIAMAWRAGCRVANLEFNQFHPTCLYHPKAKSFLISEAVRGEGGHLLLPDGTRFMSRFDSRAELATRDVVARAIDHEMKRLGLECVYLDIHHKSPEFIREHFPTIYEKCLSYNIDITREAIPVVPAAHYTCGGIVTDLTGHTDLPGLYAIGETAYTGLHGANRMASNSLLECLVFASAASADIQKRLSHVEFAPSPRPWDETRVTNSDEEVVVSHNWDELRRMMWDYVGIVRTNKRLQRARHRVDLLKQETQEYYSHFRVTKDLLELRNLIVVADLMIRCATQRHESRGLHYTLDYPQPDDVHAPHNTILKPPIRKVIT